MKKTIICLAASFLAMVVTAGSLAEARAQIGNVIENPDKMTEVMKGLSAADQKDFLADVNEAIKGLPGSNEKKAATFLNVNKAALRGAAKGNLTTLIAEVFATVPAEALTLINERFAADLFNRAADTNKTYTDEEFKKIAEAVVKAVVARTASEENGAARATFAILMMERASNGSPADLRETLISELPADAQNKARVEWLPAAKGENQTQTYEPLLGEMDAGQQINVQVAMRFAGPQLLESMLGELVEGTPLVNTSIREVAEGGTSARDSGVNPAPPTEPQGYQGQTL